MREPKSTCRQHFWQGIHRSLQLDYANLSIRTETTLPPISVLFNASTAPFASSADANLTVPKPLHLQGPPSTQWRRKLQQWRCMLNRTFALCGAMQIASSFRTIVLPTTTYVPYVYYAPLWLKRVLHCIAAAGWQYGFYLDRLSPSIMTSARSRPALSAKWSLRFCHVHDQGRLCTTTWTAWSEFMPMIMHNQ